MVRWGRFFGNLGRNVVGGLLGGGGGGGGRGGNVHTETHRYTDASTHIGGHNVGGDFVGGNVVSGDYNTGTIVSGHSGNGGNVGHINVMRDRIMMRTSPNDFDLDQAISELPEGSQERLEAMHLRQRKMELEDAKRSDDAQKLASLGESADILLVESCDLHVQENSLDHHTQLYACTDRGQLVVRRGQEFKATLTFQRPYDANKDDINLVFKMGPRPNNRYGTHHVVKLTEEKTQKDLSAKVWRAHITSTSGNSVTLAVATPPDAIVGQWELSVLTIKESGTQEYEFLGTGDVIVLFNPWCPDDQVHYTGDKADLDEYILNDSGAKFSGTYKSIKTTPWSYGQFQEDILPICLHLLRKANTSGSATNMANPVTSARSLAWIVSYDVLDGDWSKHRMSLADVARVAGLKGSAEVLRRYMAGRARVRYGQSWVFSHVLVSICRALGIPCRSVTNYASAHDTDESLTQDIYVNEDGELTFSHDTRWDFHSWNDVWMTRPDLDLQLGVKGKYDGWQALDATPQERSGSSSFQSGPAPLAAIKQGEVTVGHDTKVFFAAVNADVCTWLDASPPVLLDVDTQAVGRMMSTKFPDGKPYNIARQELGDRMRQDVTGDYKYTEGCLTERDAVRKAVGQGKMAETLFNNKSGVTVKLDEDSPSPPLGQSLPVKLVLSNTSASPRVVNLRLIVRPSNSWGGIIGEERIAVISEEVKIAPNSNETKVYELVASDYNGKCDESMTMRALVKCEVEGFETSLFTSGVVSATLPDITITGPDGVPPGDEFELTVEFQNPLTDRQLSRCWLTMGGDQIYPTGRQVVATDTAYMIAVGDLKPGEKKTMKVKVRSTVSPQMSKVRTVDVGLTSRELPELSGSFSQKLA